jgi:hypothetical protein
MKVVLTIVGLLAGLSGQMFATPLPVGPPVPTFTAPVLTCLSTPTPCAVDASHSPWHTVPTTGGASGSYVEAVYTATSGPNVGDLDFLFQLTNASSSTDSIKTIGVQAFAGSQILGAAYTDSAFTAMAGPSSPDAGTTATFLAATTNVNPNSITQGAPTQVNFNFITQASNASGGPYALIGPNTKSATILIETNETTYDPLGTTLLVTSGGLTLSGANLVISANFEPLAPTPEPGFYGLMAFGIVALLFSAKRYSRKRADLTA